MDTASHPDPFQDAMSHGLQRAVQVASSVMTGAQVHVHLKRTQARALAERDERGRRALNAQIRADRDAARAGWSPALDPGWLPTADLFQTAQAWGTAMPYADRAMPWYEPAAATAMRKCEERLRDLHPYAMARYDRLRGDGMSSAEAMREAAPLFARPSRVYDPPSTPRPVLQAGDGMNLTWTADPPADSPSPRPGPGPGPGQTTIGDDAWLQERRGRQILDALQARAREQRRDPLGEAEQRTVLETITSLPPEIIDKVVKPGTTAGLVRALLSRAGSAGSPRTADLDAVTGLTATPQADERSREPAGARSAAPAADAGRSRAARTVRPWEHDFPMPIHAVVASTATGPVAAPPAAARAPVQQPVRGDRSVP